MSVSTRSSSSCWTSARRSAACCCASCWRPSSSTPCSPCPSTRIARRWLSRSLPQQPRGRRRQPPRGGLSPLQQGLRTQGPGGPRSMIDPAGPPPADQPPARLRVALLGGIALALFAIIFFRLWYLQVLSGDQYLAEANDNQVREERIQAPRGDIVDRNGETIVTTAGPSSSRSAPPAARRRARGRRDLGPADDPALPAPDGLQGRADEDPRHPDARSCAIACGASRACSRTRRRPRSSGASSSRSPRCRTRRSAWRPTSRARS